MENEKKTGKTSEAQKRATAKYARAKRDRMTIDAAKGARARWQACADAEGLTLNAWTIKTLDKAAAEITHQEHQ